MGPDAVVEGADYSAPSTLGFPGGGTTNYYPCTQPLNRVSKNFREFSGAGQPGGTMVLSTSDSSSSAPSSMKCCSCCSRHSSVLCRASSMSSSNSSRRLRSSSICLSASLIPKQCPGLGSSTQPG